MPIKRCKRDNSQGWKWGESGKCFPTKKQAQAQAKAAYASGYKKKKK